MDSGTASKTALSPQEPQRTIDQLSALLEATRLLNSTLDVAELIEVVLRIGREQVNAERGSVYLVDREHAQIWTIVAQGGKREEVRLPIGSGVAGQVAATGIPVNVSDASALPGFASSHDQKSGNKTRALLCIPIRHEDGEIVGVLELRNKQPAGSFTAGDQEFLAQLSGHIASALRNAAFHRAALEKERNECELEMARGIQRSLLPDAPPAVPGYQLAVANHPCSEVGGDYYDFLSLGPQTQLLVVADVEGKGLASAMAMSKLQATLRALVTQLHSLEVLALSLNEMMFNDTKSRKFLSVFLGLLDTRHNGLHYINAGHVPPIVVDGESGEYRLLEEGGTVVGLFAEAEYNRGTYKLRPGDIFVACTDGITGPRDLHDEKYGSARLAQCVSRNRHRTAEEIIDSVLSDLTNFARGAVQVDDQVLMVMKVTAG